MAEKIQVSSPELTFSEGKHPGGGLDLFEMVVLRPGDRRLISARQLH